MLMVERLMTLATDDLKPGEVHGVLGLRLRDHLAPLGFSLVEGGLQAVVFRQHGSIRQAITLHVPLGSEQELQDFAQQFCGFCSGKLARAGWNQGSSLARETGHCRP